jgi:hypothetical protein
MICRHCSNKNFLKNNGIAPDTNNHSSIRPTVSVKDLQYKQTPILPASHDGQRDGWRTYGTRWDEIDDGFHRENGGNRYKTQDIAIDYRQCSLLQPALNMQGHFVLLCSDYTAFA